MKTRIAKLLTLAALTVGALSAVPSAASANFAGDACNHLRYGGSQSIAAQFSDARWGAFTWYWLPASQNPYGFYVNTSQMRADGSGYCYGTWYMRHNWDGRNNFCRFYANKAANGSIYSRWDGPCYE